VAASAAAPLLATVAGDLATTAAQPLPPQSEVRIGRHTLRYRSMGVDPATVAAARAATLDGPPAPGDQLKQLARCLIAAAALVAVIGIAVGAAAFGVTLALVIAAMGVWLRYDAHQRVIAAQYLEGRRRSEWARLEQQIAEVETAVAELRVQAQRAAEDAPTTRARLDGQLAASATVLAQRPSA